MERDSFDHSEEPPEEDSHINVQISRDKKTKNTVELSRTDLSHSSNTVSPTKLDNITNKGRHR